MTPKFLLFRMRPRAGFDVRHCDGACEELLGTRRGFHSVALSRKTPEAPVLSTILVGGRGQAELPRIQCRGADTISEWPHAHHSPTAVSGRPNASTFRSRTFCIGPGFLDKWAT